VSELIEYKIHNNASETPCKHRMGVSAGSSVCCKCEYYGGHIGSLRFSCDHDDKPRQLDEIDYRKIIKSCNDYIEFISSPDYHEDSLGNYKQEIFENAMEAVFGNPWPWINGKY